MTLRAHPFGQGAFLPEALTHSAILQMPEHSGLCRTWNGAQGRGPTFHYLGSHRFLAWPRGPDYLLLFLIIAFIWGVPTNTGHHNSGSGVSMNCPYNSFTPVSHPTPSPTYLPQNEWIGQGGSQRPLLCGQHGHKPGWWDCDSLLSGPQPQEGTNIEPLLATPHVKSTFFIYQKPMKSSGEQEVDDLWPGVCSLNTRADRTLKGR